MPSISKNIKMKPELLIVDDDEEIRAQLKWALIQDYGVFLAGDRPGAMQAFRDHAPLVILLDLGLPPSPAGPEEGLATLSEMLAENGAAKVIIATGQGEKEIALRAVGAGAYDFLTKPVELSELKVILKRAFNLASLEGSIANCRGNSRWSLLKACWAPVHRCRACSVPSAEWQPPMLQSSSWARAGLAKSAPPWLSTGAGRGKTGRS